MEYELKPITVDAPMTDERRRLMDQRTWAVQLMVHHGNGDPKRAVNAAKVLIEYVESGS